jgi:hypothetical protein
MSTAAVSRSKIGLSSLVSYLWGLAWDFSRLRGDPFRGVSASVVMCRFSREKMTGTGGISSDGPIRVLSGRHVPYKTSPRDAHFGRA